MNVMPQPWALNLSVPKTVPISSPVLSFGMDDILHKPLDFSLNNQQILQNNCHRQVFNSFSSKHINSCLTSSHQAHTVTSRDVQQTVKNGLVCRKNHESTESTACGSVD